MVECPYNVTLDWCELYLVTISDGSKSSFNISLLNAPSSRRSPPPPSSVKPCLFEDTFSASVAWLSFMERFLSRTVDRNLFLFLLYPIGTVSLIGNLISLTTFYRLYCKNRAIYVQQLAIISSDIVSIFFGSIWVTHSMFFYSWGKPYFCTRPAIGYVSVGLSAGLFGTLLASVLLLAYSCYDRYTALLFPMDFASLNHKRRVTVAFLVSYAFSTTIAAVFIMPWPEFHQTVQPYHSFCQWVKKGTPNCSAPSWDKSIYCEASSSAATGGGPNPMMIQRNETLAALWLARESENDNLFCSIGNANRNRTTAFYSIAFVIHAVLACLGVLLVKEYRANERWRRAMESNKFTKPPQTQSRQERNEAIDSRSLTVILFCEISLAIITCTFQFTASMLNLVPATQRSPMWYRIAKDLLDNFATLISSVQVSWNFVFYLCICRSFRRELRKSFNFLSHLTAFQLGNINCPPKLFKCFKSVSSNADVAPSVIELQQISDHTNE